VPHAIILAHHAKIISFQRPTCVGYV